MDSTAKTAGRFVGLLIGCAIVTASLTLGFGLIVAAAVAALTDFTMSECSDLVLSRGFMAWTSPAWIAGAIGGAVTEHRKQSRRTFKVTKRAPTNQTVKGPTGIVCRVCGSTVHASAKRCPHCTNDLTTKP